MHDFDFAFVDQWSQDFVLTSLIKERVVIRFRAINPDDFFLSILRKLIHQELRLQFAHLLVIEGHVKIEIAVGD
jgi:hypothetical protein